MSAINLRGGWALIKNTWLMWMQQRSFFFLLAFGWMIPPLIYLFVWSTAAGGETIGSMTRGAFVAYYLVLVIVNQITYSIANWTVGDVIRYGGLNQWLLRPLAPIFNVLSTEFAGKVVFLAFTIPVALVLSLLLKPEWNISAQGWQAFIPALLMAWALRFFWGYWLALLAFWSTRADGLLALQDALIFLLAGQVAPTQLLPGWLGTLARILPFRYMVSFPVEVLLGHVQGHDLRVGFIAQTVWLCFALMLYAVVWQRGLRRYSAIGG